MAETRALTTGQAARYCCVSQATIINWIKKGKLDAYATPGGHYRILLPDFLSFLETYKMPVDSALRTLACPRVLVVSRDPQSAAITQILQKNGSLDVTLYTSYADADAQVARLRPDAVVFDLRGTESPTLRRPLRARSQHKPIALLMIGNPEDEQAAQALGADAYLPISAIADRLEAELLALLTP